MGGSKAKKSAESEDMEQQASIQSLIPFDIALKIASSLQLSDVCSLGSCSRFWRELCASDFIWVSLSRNRWPSFVLSKESSALEILGWKGFYVERHNNMAHRASVIVKYVEKCSQSGSLEVGAYLKAMEDLSVMQLGFKDIHMFLFKPKLNVLLNLVGLHYCINWLGVPAEYAAEALDISKISDRKVCVRWWKLGRWLHGFRMRDESHSRCVSLLDLAIEKDNEVLGVLHRGAVHEVLRVQISVANPTHTPWSCPSMEMHN